MKSILIIPITFFIACLTFYFLFTTESTYNSSLKHVTKNYQKVDGKLSYDNIPYTKLDNGDLYSWDAGHYFQIKENNYKIGLDPNNQYIFAFFPMFPFLWKVFGFGKYGVIFLNFFLFLVGIFFIMKSIDNDLKKRAYEVLLICCLPMNIAFFIPYTEALFFATLSCGIYGLIRKNYFFYFVGMCLAAMTRPAAVIIILSFILTEVYFLFSIKPNSYTLIRLVKKVLPLVIGTLIVSVIQNFYGSDGLLGFYKAQSTWGWELSWPKNFEDWSMEQYTLNISMILFIAPIVLYYPIRKLLQKRMVYNESNYVLILSSIYLIGTTLYCLLYHKGSLNGIFRYTTCTSFFIFWLLFMIRKYRNSKNETIMHSVLIMLVAVGLFLSSPAGFSPYWGVEGLGLNYGPEWKFLDSGFIIVTLIAISTLFNIMSFKKTSIVFLGFAFLYNALWTSYLFNVFLVGGPLFT